MTGPRRRRTNQVLGVFDKAYVLNLDSRPDRLARVSAHLGALGIDFERVAGVDETAGFFGCALTHTAAWEKALADGCERALFFEDDVALRDDTPALMALVAEQLRPVRWDVLYLGVNLFYHSRYSRPVSPNLRAFDRGSHLHAYALPRRALERALPAARAIMARDRAMLIDLFFTWASPGFTMLHTMPLLAVQLPGTSDTAAHGASRLWEYFCKFPQGEFVRHCSELRRALAALGYGRKIPRFLPPPDAEVLLAPGRRWTARR